MRSVFAPQEYSIFSHTLFCLLRIFAQFTVGYQFELEVNTTADNHDISMTEGDILTDGCGVGVISKDGSYATLLVGDIRASTIGLKSWTASGSNKIHADKVTVKKGLKKGTYKVKVMAKGSANYKTSAWKTVTFKIRGR